ncbi:MAG TPA: HAD family hydrolase [Caulobacteraceae bacterium]|jgi:hypothetical protein
MTFAALATDFDGTLAKDGRVDAPTLEALGRLKSADKRLIIVTGRWLEDMQHTFDAMDLFDAVVAENGALVFLRDGARKIQMGEPPPEALVRALRDKDVPLSVGQVIISTSEPHATTVLEAIRELGLEWQVIFNKGAVMLLPPGVNKATGLVASLRALKLSPRDVVAIGDAENDHALLSACGCAVAVANAVPSLKAAADIVTEAGYGAGVTELIDGWLNDPDRLFSGLPGRVTPPGDPDLEAI